MRDELTKLTFDRVIAMLHNGLLVAQDAPHAERAKQLLREGRQPETLNGVDGIEAELVAITAEEWQAMNDAR